MLKIYRVFGKCSGLHIIYFLYIYFENSENVDFTLIKETFARETFFTNWKTLSKFRDVNFFAIEYKNFGIFAYNSRHS